MAAEQKLSKEEMQKQIVAFQNELDELENKLLRSMSTLLESVLDKTEPPETEVKFFKTLMSLISMKREMIRTIYYDLNQNE